jgi:hypothetical protein
MVETYRNQHAQCILSDALQKNSQDWLLATNNPDPDPALSLHAMEFWSLHIHNIMTAAFISIEFFIFILFFNGCTAQF